MNISQNLGHRQFVEPPPMSTTVSGVDLIAAANSFNPMARDEVGGVDPADIGVDPTRPGDLFLSAEQLKQLERERKKVGIVGEH